ncbi:MAG: glycosyltransferase [Bacteroidales bacterium]|nr:glycosyltransferase [Bacteroidales bacterium]
MINPLVSIVCDVYNHGPYLRNALDGFIMQQVSFPIEILIHDDASTDNSAEIIREYENRYPDLFRPIYETENQYHKQHLWADIQFPRAQGKYIALCEGDDYWTDPLKLQKQVDYMEAHPDCSLCFTNAIIHWYDGAHEDSVFAQFEEKDYSGVQLCEKWISPTASFVFKTEFCKEFAQIVHKYLEIIIGDSPLLLTCAQNGKIHGIPDITCVYGKHESAWTQYTDALKTFQSARSWEAHRAAFGREYHRVMTDTFTGQYLLAAYRAWGEKNLNILIKSIYRGFLRQPIIGFRSIIKLLKERHVDSTK